MARSKKNKEKPLNDDVDSGIVMDFQEFQALIVKEIRNITRNDENFKPGKYPKDRIRTFLDKPQDNERQLREVSQHLFVTSAQYRRLIAYFSSMLTFDYVLTPIAVPDEKMNASAFRKSYDAASWYLEQFNVKHELLKIVSVLMLEGVYYGYEWKTKDSFMIQRLPTSYCKITGFEDATWTFAFDFSYFDKDRLLIEVYPSEFKSKYNKYLADSQNMKWQEVDPANGVCFKFDETTLMNIPPFTGVFEDAMDLREFKDLYKIKTKIENVKLLVQKILMKTDPKNEKDFVISLPSVKVFHNGIKQALPEGVTVVSTPMEVTEIDFEKARDKEDKVGNAERNFYGSTGTSSLLFNSDKTGSVGLEKSIQTDEGFMFPLLRQFERYFRKRLIKQVTKNAYQFKIIMPDLTIYNRATKHEEYLKDAQFGLPVSFLAASMGIQAVDLVSLVDFETFLGLKDKMTPLVSSHTQSAGDGGRPKKVDGTLTDAGAVSKDANKNAT